MTSVDEEKRVTEYTVLESIQTSELVRLVNKAIRDGWQPLGGMAGTTSSPVGSPRFYQAMGKMA